MNATFGAALPHCCHTGDDNSQQKSAGLEAPHTLAAPIFGNDLVLASYNLDTSPPPPSTIENIQDLAQLPSRSAIMTTAGTMRPSLPLSPAAVERDVPLNSCKLLAVPVVSFFAGGRNVGTPAVPMLILQ